MVPPWVAEPYRLWSLSDFMLRFYAASSLAGLSNLHLYKGQIALFALNSGQHDWEQLKTALRDTLETLAHQCEKDKLPVSTSLVRQIRRAASQLEPLGRSDAHNTSIITLLSEVAINFVHELEEHRFYVIDSRLAYLMEANQPFGESVADRFPDASKDIAAASRCLALDEWTASVFHCMRVAEHGLRGLARYVALDMTRNIELETWKTIIDGIEAKIRSAESLPKNSAKSERLRVLSEAASQVRYFKDAWRNHVMHSRTFYDAREALGIWEHTRDFMLTLANALPAEEGGGTE
jgi:hypothetical protein